MADELQLLVGGIDKHVYARPRGADHFRERLLAYLRYSWLRLSLLPKVSHQEEHSCQTLLARIEELIDQVLLNSGVPGQYVRHKYLGEIWLS